MATSAKTEARVPISVSSARLRARISASIPLADDPGLERDQSGVRRCEAARVEIERSQVVLEVDVEPLAAGSARLGDSDRNELGSDSLPAGPRSHHGVEDEGMDRAVPRYVNEADELVAVRAQTQPRLCLCTWPFQSSSSTRWLNASAWSAFTAALSKSPRQS